MNISPDVAVIGGGPGGYVAAIRLGQLGKKVLLVEKERVGGVCLNRGCIPTKALLHAAHVAHAAHESAAMGISFQVPEVDLGKLNGWKQGITDRLVRGVEMLLSTAGVETISGHASLKGPDTVMVSENGGPPVEVKPEYIVIATGSSPISLPGLTPDGEVVISSDQAWELKRVPERLLVIGAGAVGLEFATVNGRLGSQVTVVEIMKQVIPGIDNELATILQRVLRRENIQVLLDSRATQYDIGDPCIVAVEGPGGSSTIEVDQILVAVGRRANTQDLDLDAAGVALTDRGFISVDEHRRTSAERIFAIGDVAGPPLLAHKASREGIVAAEVIAGLDTVYDPKGVPNCVYTDPEVATVGLTEEEAQTQGHSVSVGRFPLIACGRALTLGRSDGIAKLVVDAETDALLGMHLIAPEASSMIAEGALAMELNATASQIGQTIHPHPTVSEMIMEAAENVHGKAIHTRNR